MRFSRCIYVLLSKMIQILIFKLSIENHLFNSYKNSYKCFIYKTKLISFNSIIFFFLNKTYYFINNKN